MGNYLLDKELYEAIHKAPLQVEPLLKQGADPNSLFMLHQAALWGRVDACRLLLEHGADYSRRDSNGYTALQYAVGLSPGHVDIARLLLDKDPTAIDELDPLDRSLDSLASSVGNQQVIALIAAHRNSRKTEQAVRGSVEADGTQCPPLRLHARGPL
jgi:ankyrin repeat protein